MNRPLGLSGIKNLEQFKSRIGSSSGAPNAKMLSSSFHKPPDSVASGSFANLKLTAEKLLNEQASAKTDLEFANSKLKKLTEQIGILEEKLQKAFNENSKLFAKQKEDERQWKGLESKFASTKALCDELTETLQQLTVQVQNAEKDKVYFEDKLSATSVALDKLHEHIKSLSLRLDTSEEITKTRDRELTDLRLEKEKLETFFRNEQDRATRQIEMKDDKIKQLKEDVAANMVTLENLTSEMEKLHVEMRVKEDNLLELSISKEKLERDNENLISSQKALTNRLEMANKEIQNFEDFVTLLVVRFTELENQSLTFSERISQLNAIFDKSLALAQQEKDLVSKCTKKKFDHIHNECSSVISEKNALQLVNHELKNKVIELQKEQEFAMVQHAEECRLAEEKIQNLESEAERLVSEQNGMQALVVKLEDNLRTSTESSILSDTKRQEALQKFSELECESKRIVDELKADLMKKQGEVDLLQREIERSEENVGSLNKRIIELENSLEEKNKFIMELKTIEKQFEEQKAEIMASLADRESKLEEAKKQYDQMLESKHLELSRHLKDISQRNDQAISDIKRKYEIEKEEAVNIEKQKAEDFIRDTEKTCEQKIAECKEECRHQLQQMQEEHAALISNLQLEHANKEMNLKAKLSEELKRAELHAETELREKTKLLRSEHEAQLRALRCEQEDEFKRLQEELDIQKAKEERQRALLQLQWKVMSDNPQEDQEVNSKKTYSISSTKMRNKDRSTRIRHESKRNDEEKEPPYLKATETPISNLLKNVENVNTGTPMSLPNHSRKVTRHEYEIETSNGRTITKRKKTRSTVMFEDPRKQRKRNTPRTKTPKCENQGVKGSGVHPNAPNIGDLFTEGSLNPYVDDPYAFD
ncbi:synaptonemal complex protein 1-like isoform X2 [Andrographis paniculata]|uniref:synaptonemal complex protein 1-like isoform X2 n=1 Tax=Andrographis paniculata TaxID=175694 RepID=UPI0021E95545|nr:synaptonemal complex protein 1-like isoform X2 [Andrographis paniculata]